MKGKVTRGRPGGQDTQTREVEAGTVGNDSPLSPDPPAALILVQRAFDEEGNQMAPRASGFPPHRVTQTKTKMKMTRNL
ncbi:hypothetical protein EYF80_029176 [Liparis tanakae]|uniref:Uncharacterized protein n=1 Tax=Liparis tanakae TaxID=230148 RepID=A0A4Z2H5R0_9TELE|nr:hypothetical protein EYF80_029176 [Liparis tanakae]